MSKVIRITFSNGHTFEIDAEVIAESRARYYSNLDYERGDVEDLNSAYADEYLYSLNDNTELGDWFKNNMDWSDVAPVARIVASKGVDYDKEFTNADYEIIELDGDED